MTSTVNGIHNVNDKAPQNFQELVDLIHMISVQDRQVNLQISGYSEKVVEELSNHFQTNFFPTQVQQDLNPFTIIYISEDGSIHKYLRNYKSKITIYARREIHSNH